MLREAAENGQNGRISAQKTVPNIQIHEYQILINTSIIAGIYICIAVGVFVYIFVRADESGDERIDGCVVCTDGRKPIAQIS